MEIDFNMQYPKAIVTIFNMVIGNFFIIQYIDNNNKSFNLSSNLEFIENAYNPITDVIIISKAKIICIPF